MKLKHISLLIAAMAIMFMGLSFASCKDDDEKGNGNLAKTIVGAWVYDDGDVAVFNADGTGYWEDDDPRYNEPFVYRVDGNWLYTSDPEYPEYTDVLYAISVSKNKIVMKYYIEDYEYDDDDYDGHDDFGYYETITLTRR